MPSVVEARTSPSPVRAAKREKSLPRHRYCRNHIGQHAVRIEAFELRLRLENHAMAQHRRHGAFDIIRNEKIAAVECGHSLRHKHHAERRTRACTQRERWPLART